MRARLVAGLALSCHPGPCLVVTAVSAGLASLAGSSAGRIWLVALAILAGQLTIGWSNDLLDRSRDLLVRRPDKPLATDAVSPRLVTSAIGVSAAAAIALSLALGHRAALVTLLGVAAGLAYNLGLKATALSPLPYLIGFGTLPATATLSSPDYAYPPWWAVLASGLLGAAAHFANVLPDLGEDEATGVRGLPHRFGAPGSAAAGPALLMAASFILVFAPPGKPSNAALVGLVAVSALAVGCAAYGLRKPLSRLTFVGLALLGAANLALFAATGGSLT
jgi:4-hydroxybenzoate polyprenyltransferase